MLLVLRRVKGQKCGSKSLKALEAAWDTNKSENVEGDVLPGERKDTLIELASLHSRCHFGASRKSAGWQRNSSAKCEAANGCGGFEYSVGDV